MEPQASLSATQRTLAAIGACILLLTACSPKKTPVNREVELIFDFVNIDPADSDYTVILSDRDATMLGSASESFSRDEEPEETYQDFGSAYGPRVKIFTASSFVDTIDGDGHLPEAPCLEDAVMVRSPNGDISELFEAGLCIGINWIVPDRTINDPFPSTTTLAPPDS